MGVRWIGERVVSLKSLGIRQAITLGVIATSALILWKSLVCLTGSESPVVVVLSESMEPAFQKADTNTLDILFLSMSKDLIRAGEIVVFNIEGRSIRIVNRVIKINDQFEKALLSWEGVCVEKVPFPQAKVLFLKGFVSHNVGPTYCSRDNNNQDDREGFLYAPGQLWLQQQHIMGRAVGFLPYVGWVTIIMTEKPILKYILIGALGLLVVVSKD